MIDLALPGLVFNDEHHAYTVNGERMIGVTSLVRRFAPPFPAVAISNAIAKKRGDGSTGDDVRAEWAEKRDCGTAAHAYAATWAAHTAAGGIGTAPGAGECAEPLAGFVAGVFAFYMDLRPEPLAWEQPVCWPAAGVAGTLDILCRIGGELLLCDWKTDNELVYTSRERMLPPISHLPNRSWTEHSLQLSCYRLMISEQYGVDVDGLALIHLTNGGYALQRCVYLRSEVEDILEHYQQETPA